MDRYEYKVRVAQIKSLIENKDFYEAMNIADTIDWRRVRSVSMLCTVSEIYKINRRYDDAKGILMMAYGRYPEGRTIVYALCELSIKLGEITEAVKYLKEYMALAKGDSGIYILQYKLYKSQGVSAAECIDVLTKLKAAEYSEKWAYELAYQYHLDGQEKKCVEECDEMILWFGRGKYVTKALELKMQHAALTEDQQRKYDMRNEPERPIEDIIREQEEEEIEKLERNVLQFAQSGSHAEREEDTEEELPSEEVQESYSTEQEQVHQQETYPEETYQAESYPEETYPEESYSVEAEAEEAPVEAAEEVSEEVSEEPAESEEVSQNIISITSMAEQVAAARKYGDMQAGAIEDAEENPISIEIKQIDISDQPTKRIPSKEIEAEISRMQNTQEINVPPFNVGKYSTMNLQAEIKKNLAEFAKRTGQPIRQKEERIEHIEETIARAEAAAKPAEAEVAEEEETASAATELEAEEIPADAELPAETASFSMDLSADEEEAIEEPPINRPYKIVVHGMPDGKEDISEEEDLYGDEETISEADEPEEIKVSAKIKEGKPKKYAAPKPREVEGFSEAEKEIFADFLPMHDLPEIIKEALGNIKMEGNKGNVLITGNEQSARIKLAGALANDLRLNNPEFLGKIAKISATTFNTKDAKKAIQALDAGALVIERAGDLSEETLEDIHEILTHQDTSIVLFLEDARLSLRNLASSHDWINEFFDVKINIPTYTNDDLVFHGREYARQQEYSIDDMGVLALYTRIDEMQTADHFVTINEVEEIVDEAIKHADKRTPSHLIDLLMGKRYDDNDLIVLREKDFI